VLFNSYTFLVFFAIVYLCYLATQRSVRLQNALLLVASYVFYGAWDWRFLGLILLSTAVDFIAASRIEDASTSTERRTWLTVSVIANLGVLAFFKYLDFALDSFRELAGLVGLEISQRSLGIILPVGISFYTFQTLAYTIDVYRRRIPACRDPLGFALFVAFFPQLVAGPIERATHLLPQMLRPRTIRRVDMAIGLQFVVVGYFLKVVLADSVGPLVDQYYANPQRYAGSIAWIANLGFAVQIYGDFAGYTLIARGTSRWMGFRLMSNFRQPYLAISPRDFWSRWHRTLSLWLRRYLYFELGGSRFGFRKTCRNLMLTMLLGGLWHGASWNFVLWGLFHGSILVIEHAWRARSSRAAETGDVGLGRRCLQTVGMFVLTLFGWTLFRAESAAQIGQVLASMFSTPFMDVRTMAFAQPIALSLALILVLDVWQERSGSELVLLRAPRGVRVTIYTMMLLSVIAVGFRPVTFLYFQF
jgi:D-alanyl-lipoteichoic acid acyltransferase DltB (MBOAT superfamily)